MSKLVGRFPNIALSFKKCRKFFPGDPRIRDFSIDCGSDVLGKQANAEEGFMLLCEKLSTMPNLEVLRLAASIKIKSHASITEIQAHNLQFLLCKLAAACHRLRYVKIGRLAWRIHPKVRHTKPQVCTFEELDSWETIAEGPATFCNPRPLGDDVVHEDW